MLTIDQSAQAPKQGHSPRRKHRNKVTRQDAPWMMEVRHVAFFLFVCLFLWKALTYLLIFLHGSPIQCQCARLLGLCDECSSLVCSLMIPLRQTTYFLGRWLVRGCRRTPPASTSTKQFSFFSTAPPAAAAPIIVLAPVSYTHLTLPTIYSV